MAPRRKTTGSKPKTPRKPRFRSKSNRQLPGDPNYVIVNPHSILIGTAALIPEDADITSGQNTKCPGRPKFVEPLGTGSAGLTYRALYKKAIDRAIKFLSPAPDVDKQGQMDIKILKKEF